MGVSQSKEKQCKEGGAHLCREVTSRFLLYSLPPLISVHPKCKLSCLTYLYVIRSGDGVEGGGRRKMLSFHTTSISDFC